MAAMMLRMTVITIMSLMVTVTMALMAVLMMVNLMAVLMVVFMLVMWMGFTDDCWRWRTWMIMARLMVALTVVMATVMMPVVAQMARQCGALHTISILMRLLCHYYDTATGDDAIDGAALC